MKTNELIAFGRVVLLAVALGAAISNPTLATLFVGVVTKWLGS